MNELWAGVSPPWKYSLFGPQRLGNAVAVPLAVGPVRVLGAQAVEPAALILGVEHAAGNQRLDPRGEIIRGGE